MSHIVAVLLVYARRISRSLLRNEPFGVLDCAAVMVQALVLKTSMVRIVVGVRFLHSPHV